LEVIMKKIFVLISTVAVAGFGIGLLGCSSGGTGGTGGTGGGTGGTGGGTPAAKECTQQCLTDAYCTAEVSGKGPLDKCDSAKGECVYKSCTGDNGTTGAAPCGTTFKACVNNGCVYCNADSDDTTPDKVLCPDVEAMKKCLANGSCGCDTDNGVTTGKSPCGSTMKYCKNGQCTECKQDIDCTTAPNKCDTATGFCKVDVADYCTDDASCATKIGIGVAADWSCTGTPKVCKCKADGACAKDGGTCNKTSGACECSDVAKCLLPPADATFKYICK
jgi:hypothetical protein